MHKSMEYATTLHSIQWITTLIHPSKSETPEAQKEGRAVWQRCPKCPPPPSPRISESLHAVSGQKLLVSRGTVITRQAYSPRMLLPAK